MLNLKTTSKYKCILISSMIIFIIVFISAVIFGSVGISVIDVSKIIGNKIFAFINTQGISDSAIIIIGNIRLPRVILTCFIGAGLSIAGATAQGLLKNPLADGSTLGIASGASLGAVIAIALGIQIPFIPQFGIMIMSMLFGFLSFLVILGFSKKIDKSYSTNTIILTGVIFSMFSASITSLIIALSNENATKQIVFWSMGSFSGTSFSKVNFVVPIILIATLVLVRYSKELDAFSFGEEQAKYIGVNVKRTKIIILIMISIIVGVSVASCGSIAFVGLAVPHIARSVVGPSHVRLLPVSIFFGASFMTLADLISRTIISPRELPVGVITSFVGAIVFMTVFYSKRQKT